MRVTTVLVCTTLGAVLFLAASACGPPNLSALGNPGDYCTERTACTDGTDCRPTDDGYRCMGSAEADRERTKAKRSNQPAEHEPLIEDGGEHLGPMPERGSKTQPDESGDIDFSEDGAEEGEPGYVPPSRRRRGGR